MRRSPGSPCRAATPAPAGDVFAFVGAKGGVGTTTAAVNVATALARLRAGSVLLIDLHLAYGDAAIYLGAEPRFSVVDALENTHRLDEAFSARASCVKTKAGPDLLASPDRAVGLLVDAGRVRTLIDSAAHHYRYVVLDLPPLGPGGARRARSGEEDRGRRQPGTGDGAGREPDGRHAAPAVRQGARRASCVSRYDPNAGIGQDDIERVVGSKIRHLLPSDYRVALEALNTGRPLALEQPHPARGRPARCLRDELAELIGRRREPRKERPEHLRPADRPS